MENKQIYCSVKEFIGDNKLRAYASTLRPDRDNEIILPDAYLEHKDTFMKNPVLLKFHDYWSESVGRITMLDHDDYGIVIEIEFAPTDEGRKFATLYKGGFMNAFSIGFIPKKIISSDSDEVINLMSKFGINKASVSRIYKSIELLEVSCVPVPSNRDAIVLQAKSFCGNNVNELEEIIADLKDLKEKIKEAPVIKEEVIEEKKLDKDNNIEEKSFGNNVDVDEAIDEIFIPESDKSEESIQASKDIDTAIDAEALISKLVDKIKTNIEESINCRFENFAVDIFKHFDKTIEDLSFFIDKEFKAFYGSVIGKKQEVVKNNEQKVFEIILNELKEIKK